MSDTLQRLLDNNARDHTLALHQAAEEIDELKAELAEAKEVIVALRDANTANRARLAQAEADKEMRKE